MLGVLASYSITVKELKIFFSKLQGEKGQWVSPNPLQRSSRTRNALHTLAPCSPTEQCSRHADHIDQR